MDSPAIEFVQTAASAAQRTRGRNPGGRTDDHPLYALKRLENPNRSVEGEINRMQQLVDAGIAVSDIGASGFGTRVVRGPEPQS